MHSNLVPNLITVHTRWGTHCGSGNETNNMVDEGLKVWQCVFGDLVKYNRLASFPGPCPASCTASDRKLGEGLGNYNVRPLLIAMLRYSIITTRADKDDTALQDLCSKAKVPNTCPGSVFGSTHCITVQEQLKHYIVEKYIGINSLKH